MKIVPIDHNVRLQNSSASEIIKDDKNSSNGLQSIYHTLDEKDMPTPIHKHLQYHAAINEHHAKKRILPDMAGGTESYDKTLLKEMKNSGSQLISKSDDHTKPEDSMTVKNKSTIGKKPNSPTQTSSVEFTKYIPLSTTGMPYHDRLPYGTLSSKNKMNDSKETENSSRLRNSDLVGTIEYIILSALAIFNLVLLGYCINNKYHGALKKMFNFRLNGNICQTSCGFCWCCKPNIPPYRVISIQDLGNTDTINDNGDSDFVFDDQYLELNDNQPKNNLGETQTKSSRAFTDDTKKSNSKSNPRGKFTRAVERSKKNKYIRLDDVFENDNDSKNGQKSGSTNGYWNPTYFSLLDETDC